MTGTEGEGSPESVLKGKKILVAEDDLYIPGLLERFLEKEGAKGVFVDNGEAALKAYDESLKEGAQQFDLVYSDNSMGPGIKGTELIRLLREKGYKGPIIFASAEVTDKIIDKKAQETGPNRQLGKPFTGNFLGLIDVIKGLILEDLYKQ